MCIDPPLNTHAAASDVMHALAYVGDLSMGQPTDHSLRTGWLATRIAELDGCSVSECATVHQTALLRWSGCTANAHELSVLIPDDVTGRATLLTQSQEDPEFVFLAGRVRSAIRSLTQIHCEVSGDIAHMMGANSAVEQALRTISATFDRTGPHDNPKMKIPISVYVVELASNLEIFSRVHGLARALEMIAARSDKVYPTRLSETVSLHASAWLTALDDGIHARPTAMLETATVPMELIADVIDLKLPWMTGHSRRVAQEARRAAALLGLSEESQSRCYRAGLLHGLGRAAVPNRIWNTPGKLSAEAKEKIRLAPYWTSRASTRIGALSGDADLGSYVGERLDGSGTFRGCRGNTIPIEGQVLAAAAAWVALQSSRPWRAAFSPEEGRAILDAEVKAGRFNRAVVDSLAHLMGRQTNRQSARDRLILTEREIGVLQCISLGHTTKEVARKLSISQRTVRTHVENVFRKLNCTSRAAAILKASTLGLF